MVGRAQGFAKQQGLIDAQVALSATSYAFATLQAHLQLLLARPALSLHSSMSI